MPENFNAIPYLDQILAIAQQKQASDIHLEMLADGLQVKLRIDGLLWAESKLEGLRFAEQLISRVKVLSQLDIAERRVPQDGRLKVSLPTGNLDVRVSIMPSVVGEDAVLRLLDKSHLVRGKQQLSVSGLGFSEQTCDQLKTIANLPYGMLLVTGPTGSGKTTTLYALLSELAREDEKTITIEDPVEYQIPGLLQIPVNEKKGLTFATGLRSILRHDPDRILVGEIRDKETAEIAVQAALTGHQVFTTLHANGVFDVINRFAHLGCDLHALGGALNAIAAQRLVRKLCDDCATSANLPERPKARTRLLSGCMQCRNTGFAGRVGFAEILQVDEPIRRMLVERAPVSELFQYASTQGFKSLFEVGEELVKNGQTDFQELARVAKKMERAV